MTVKTKTAKHFVIFATLAAIAAGAGNGPAPVASEDGVAVYFTLGGDCAAAVVKEIASARHSVLIQAFSLTSPSIQTALVAASRRGVSVRLILDSSRRVASDSSAASFHDHDIPVMIDAQHAVARHNVMLIDGETIITGSFSFSDAEDDAAEDLLIIEDKMALVLAYLAEFKRHFAHSAPYTGLGRAEPDDPSSMVGDASADTRVHVAESDEFYHRAGCELLGENHSTIRLKNARRRGLSPCDRCLPPL